MSPVRCWHFLPMFFLATCRAGILLDANLASFDERKDVGDLQVIGAGFGRTGTMSAKTALEMLGFGPTHHMFEVMGRQAFAPWDVLALNRDNETKRLNAIKEAYFGYRSQVDFPGASHFEDAMNAFPNAKVLLTTRDPENWVRSFLRTIGAFWKFRSLSSPYIFSSWMGPPIWFMTMISPMNRPMSDFLWKHFEGCETEADLAQAFRDWEAHVEATVPSHRLLKFSVKEGWAPLAKFLGVEIPDAPFPHINDSDSFEFDLKLVACMGYVVMAVMLLVLRFVARRLLRCCSREKKSDVKEE